MQDKKIADDLYEAYNQGFDNGYEQGVSVTKAEYEDYEPIVHAKWESVQNGKGCCSNCHRLDSIDNIATHCRYCGAKMDLEGHKTKSCDVCHKQLEVGESVFYNAVLQRNECVDCHFDRDEEDE